jgi:hypothetical protein
MDKCRIEAVKIVGVGVFNNEVGDLKIVLEE